MMKVEIEIFQFLYYFLMLEHEIKTKIEFCFKCFLTDFYVINSLETFA